MNELRMYVEHLFQGKVLTAEMIELKEEIYGNLMARYEDYLAEGMDAAEALAKTKASMTSVDDLLDGETGADEEAAEETAADEAMSAAPVERADGASTAVTAAQAPAVDAAPGVEPASAVEPRSVAVSAADSASEGAATGKAAGFWSRRGVRIAAVVIAVLVVLGVGGAIAFEALDEAQDAREDRAEETYERQQAQSRDGSQGGAVADATEGGGASATGALNAEIYQDSQGAWYLEGQPADDVLLAVVNAGYGAVQPYVGTLVSDASAVEALVRALPMSEWADAVDVTRGEGVLAYRYQGIPDRYDGDSIDTALVYDATAIFCAMPGITEIRIEYSESDDPNDFDYAVFKRTALEQQYGVALTGELVNEAGWKQLKDDNLYRKDFADRAMDRADVD